MWTISKFFIRLGVLAVSIGFGICAIVGVIGFFVACGHILSMP